MVADTARKEASGPFLFYNTLRRNRPRLFLQRNLRTVVESHKHALQMMRKHTRNSALGANSINTHSKTVNDTYGMGNDRKTRSKTTSSNDKAWNFPASEDILNSLIAAQTDVFELDLGAIRPMQGADVRENERANRVENISSQIDLPAWEVPCTLEVQLFVRDNSGINSDGREHLQQKDVPPASRREIQREFHDIRVRGHITNSTKRGIRVQISMDEPVRFSMNPLVAVTTMNPKSEGFRALELKIELSIFCRNKADSKMLAEEICGPANLRYQPVSKTTEKSLSNSIGAEFFHVRWEGSLRDLRPQSHLLKLRHHKDAQWVALRYGLEVNTRLSSPLSGSALQHYNGKKRQFSPNPFTTTRLDAPPREPHEIVKVIYILKSNGQDHDYRCDDYSCPLCGGLNLQSFDLLHLHLHHNHTLLQFKVDKDQQLNGQNSLITVTVGIQLARTDFLTSRRDRDNDRHQPVPTLAPWKWRKDKEDEMAWLAPKAPFDVERYQRGDETWFHKGYDMEPKARNGRAAASQRRIKSKDPEQVLDIPEHRRKRYKVPGAPPGLNFFRTVTKQPLKEGELVSESDDDIDETWTMQKRNESLAAVLKQPQVAIEFIGIFDAYMQTENLNGDIHVGDALVRFARHRARLFRNRPDLAVEFRKKAHELHQDRIINDRVLQHCSRFAEEAEQKASEPPPPPPPQPPPATPRRRTNGAATGKTAAVDSTPRTTRARVQRTVIDSDDEMELDKEKVARKDGDGDVEMVDEDTVVVQPLDEDMVPASGGEKVPLMGRCTCGQVVGSLRHAICCANSVSDELGYNPLRELTNHHPPELPPYGLSSVMCGSEPKTGQLDVSSMR